MSVSVNEDSLNDGHPELFKEAQNLKLAWLRVLVLAIPTVVAIIFGWAIYQQLVLHHPWGDHPMSDASLIGVAAVTLAPSLVVPLVVLRARLIVTVDRENVHIVFAPFASRNVPLSQISRVEARTARPFRNFGGVGARWTPRGWAYLVSGNRGVQLELNDGKQVFIGSQRPDELAQAIERARAGS